MTTPPPIPPALSPDQWAAKRVVSEGGSTVITRARDAVRIDDGGDVAVIMEECHALAALCLYGQPFGPKPEWLSVLTLLSRREMEQYEDDALKEIYAFIAALLPPHPERP